MKDILNTLRESGLTSLEAKIFLLLTELGSVPVSALAGRGGFKRTNLYNVLEKLAQKGLVTEHEKGTIRYFQAIEPESLIQIQEQNKRKIEGNIKDLKEIAPSLDAIKSPLMVKPRVRYFQGKDGISNLLDQILVNESFDAFFNPETSYQMYPGVLDNFLNNGNIRKLHIRELVVPGRGADDYIKRIKNPNHQYKLLPKGYIIYSDTLIFGNRIAFISYKEGAIAVLIESEDIVRSQKMAFEIMWHARSVAKCAY